ncbi:hypothetical protein Kpol_495p20 [Vanderwaltozyma polyspora DSM 70294]|uniref:C2H2-type domain-containing protein n=1 Tax=Vanderwaltozyma polyspora (strain ATCC 22028 / DSM 70294 / BCRC 21397 / CBS 2163 / NBRC 10782 / NRRL Y-8283 / UCD 57-17) TaxID=436907 RepID=A7TNZ7_VANPO|nr:uncharacterized protein Kpol_495p20 [Vanderwaltozyma polyspora DSM 70294]EDO16022.1 hypothetical protein Kpol_495p20 [Vanderwaltozyma polyspora DSM 70294]
MNSKDSGFSSDKYPNSNKPQAKPYGSSNFLPEGLNKHGASGDMAKGAINKGILNSQLMPETKNKNIINGNRDISNAVLQSGTAGSGGNPIFKIGCTTNSSGHDVFSQPYAIAANQLSNNQQPNRISLAHMRPLLSTVRSNQSQSHYWYKDGIANEKFFHSQQSYDKLEKVENSKIMLPPVGNHDGFSRSQEPYLNNELSYHDANNSDSFKSTSLIEYQSHFPYKRLNHDHIRNSSQITNQLGSPYEAFRKESQFPVFATNQWTGANIPNNQISSANHSIYSQTHPNAEGLNSEKSMIESVNTTSNNQHPNSGAINQNYFHQTQVPNYQNMEYRNSLSNVPSIINRPLALFGPSVTRSNELHLPEPSYYHQNLTATERLIDNQMFVPNSPTVHLMGNNRFENDNNEITKLYNQKKQQTSNKKATYECSVCGKRVTRAYSLHAHMLIHTKVRPYKCDWENCGKTFNVKSNLNRHVKIHLKKQKNSNKG